MAAEYPIVGHWYRRGRRKLFEVVAVDEYADTIELQHFDGTVEEMDAEDWPVPLLDEVGPPEDWSGSVDINPEDLPDDTDGTVHAVWRDPLTELDRLS